MPNYLGNGPLLAHILQILNGVTPGGMSALLSLFERHRVRPDEVVQALEEAKIGGPDMVAEFVSKNPMFADWYTKTRPTPKAQVIRRGDSYLVGFKAIDGFRPAWATVADGESEAMLFIPTVPDSVFTELEAHGIKREDIEILNVSVA